ncbi:MAG: hypothetical protein JXB36_13555 [Gammaproteobacteria bacterium]|nr:hypothetical protein [Gammaproteobacteria bacterium]
MNLLVILLFISIFTMGYLVHQLQVLSGYWVLVPELLSGVALLIVLARLVGGRKAMLDWRYGVFFAIFVFVLLFGFLAQSTPAGVVVAGLRNYVKFIPFFLLPLVYPFTSRQLKMQMGVLLTLLFLQTPLALYQRFVQFADKMHTGDPVRGTATTSSALTLLMCCGIALIVTLYLRKRIKLPMLLVGIAFLGLPTMLNETKSTLLMMPIAVLAPALFMPSGSRPLKKMIPLVAVGCAALLSYMAVYNTLIQHRDDGKELGSFLTEGHIEDYLYTGFAEGDGTWIGRFDSIALAMRGISGDPLRVAFGYGAGNVSESALPGFDGQYVAYVELYGVDVTQISNFMWEIGIVGLAGYLLLYWFVFRDARRLSKRDDAAGMLGQAWAVVAVIMGMALFYKSIFAMNEVAYLFWFFSGVVAREAYALRQERRSPAARPAPRREPEVVAPYGGRPAF